MNPLRTLLALLFAAAALAAAAYDITGTVTDTDNEPLPGATARLLRATADSTFVAGAVTDVDGRFTIADIRRGRYVLETTYIGLATDRRDVTVSSASVRLDTLRLRPSSMRLAEVQVVGVKTPMKVMTDTVEFNADSYLTRPNAAVEDLLKRLPGVEVDADGKITANGKEVSKILLDGKEFFADDPKVASKNLPVEIVEKLQVIDRKSDLARLTGVDDGEDETVINLTVKKGMKNGWFGTAEGGYGTDSRYLGQFNVSRFADGNQFTLLGNFNNINELGFTDSNGQRFRRFGGSQGVTASQAAGLNFNVGNGEVFRVGGDIMYSRTDRDTRKSVERQYLFPDSTSYWTQLSTQREVADNVRVDLRMKWQPDSFNIVDFRPELSLNFQTTNSTDSTLTRAGDPLRTAVNSRRGEDWSRGRSFEGGARLIYTHNFRSRPGRSISMMARVKASNVHERETSLSTTRYYLLADDPDQLEDLYTRNHTRQLTLAGRLTWTEPLGDVKRGNFLVAAYHVTHRWSDADKLVWEDGGEVYSQDLSNRFRNRFLTQQIRLGYKKVTRAINAEAGVTMVPSTSSSTNLDDPMRSIPRRSTFNVAPFARLRWKMSKNRSFNFNYRSRSSEPSMTQLQPVADTSDPLHIIQGNPDLAPTFTHYIMARFQDFDPDAQRSIMAMLHANVAQNSVVSHTSYNSLTGGRLTTYENVNGVWSGRAMNIISFPLRNKAWTFNNHFFINLSRAVGYTNDARTATTTLGLREQPSIAFRPSNLELELRPYYSPRFTHAQPATDVPTTVHDFGGTFNATYYTPFGLVLSADANYKATRGYTDGYDTNVWLLNAQISWELLRDRSLTLSVKGHDLLNQTKSIRRDVTNAYIDDIDINEVSRYIMFTVSYRFNTFGKGNEPARRDDFGGPRHGFGPPPPGAPRH